MHSNNRKGENSMVQNILQNQNFFFGLVSRKKVFSESIHYIEAHTDVAVEVLEVPISVPFKLCPDEELIEFW